MNLSIFQNAIEQTVHRHFFIAIYRQMAVSTPFDTKKCSGFSCAINNLGSKAERLTTSRTSRIDEKWSKKQS
jgi:hypothetical protein